MDFNLLPPAAESLLKVAESHSSLYFESLKFVVFGGSYQAASQCLQGFSKKWH